MPHASRRRPARHVTFALIALAIGGFAIGTTEFVAMGVLPEIAHGTHVSIPHAGYAVSAYALGVVVGAPILAGIGARRVRRSMLVWLMVAYAIANCLSALAPNFWLLTLGRFVSGLPHGAYFGIAALVAADLVPPGRRARAVASLLLGLSVANVIGVPLGTWLGQTLGWRTAFVFAGALAAITAVSVRAFVPRTPPDRDAIFSRELTALRNPHVLLAVATAAIGGGGIFAVYSYISPILTHRAHLPLHDVPFALVVWGCGMVVGNVIGGRVVDHAGPTRATFTTFVAMALMFALFSVTSTHLATAIATMFLVGGSVALPTAIQVRLMEVAGEAQTLAAALNHSAFNIANALGAWLGGIVLAANMGYAAPMWVAVALTLAGMAIFAIAIATERNARATPALP